MLRQQLQQLEMRSLRAGLAVIRGFAKDGYNQLGDMTPDGGLINGNFYSRWNYSVRARAPGAVLWFLRPRSSHPACRLLAAAVVELQRVCACDVSHHPVTSCLPCDMHACGVLAGLADAERKMPGIRTCALSAMQRSPACHASCVPCMQHARSWPCNASAGSGGVAMPAHARCHVSALRV